MISRWQNRRARVQSSVTTPRPPCSGARSIDRDGDLEVGILRRLSCFRRTLSLLSGIRDSACFGNPLDLGPRARMLREKALEVAFRQYEKLAVAKGNYVRKASIAGQQRHFAEYVAAAEPNTSARQYHFHRTR